MSGKEMRDRMLAERAAAFYGKRYWYNTPNDGRREIGVLQGLGGDCWIIAYFRESGARRSIKSPALKERNNPEVLQHALNLWAKARHLEEVV